MARCEPTLTVTNIKCVVVVPLPSVRTLKLNIRFTYHVKSDFYVIGNRIYAGI